MPPDLLIAHHFGPEFEAALAQRLPPGIRFAALPRDAAYEVPAEAEVLLAVPARAGNIVVPDTPPAGWPRRLAWVQAVSTGVDEFPSWLFQVPRVTCGRGGATTPIAEFVMASLLAVEKQFPSIWVSRGEKVWRAPNLGTLKGKVLGLLGFGAIAEAVARRALPFEMRVLAWRRSGRPSEMAGVTVADLDTVLREADYLVVTLPLTRETRRMLDADVLARVKPGVHLVNVSRGGVLDHAALLAGLDEGRIGFATLDVTDPEPLPDGHPLYAHPNVHISPHISFLGGPGNGWIDLFVENVQRFRAGEELLELVDPKLGY